MEFQEGRRINQKVIIVVLLLVFGLPLVIWALFTYPMLLYGVLLVVGMLVYAKLKNKGIMQ